METYDEKELRCCVLVQNAWRSIQARRKFAALKQAAICKKYRECHPQRTKTLNSDVTRGGPRFTETISKCKGKQIDRLERYHSRIAFGDEANFIQ
jgi:hypothetical protein